MHATDAKLYNLSTSRLVLYTVSTRIIIHSYHSAIDSSLFNNNKDAMITFVKQVSTNETLWASYHAWRTNEQEWEQWKRKYDFLRTSSFCRICRWVHAKQYGIRFDYEAQRPVWDDNLHRFCVAKNGLITSSHLVETWMVQSNTQEQHRTEITPSAETDNILECTTFLNYHMATIDVGPLRLTRTVSIHDRIVDFEVTTIDDSKMSGDDDVVNHLPGGDDLILRLELPRMKNDEGASFPHVHTQIPVTSSSSSSSSSFRDSITMISSMAIQDRSIRVTVLANWPEASFSTKGRHGLVHVMIPQHSSRQPPKVMNRDETYRIRIILEELDSLRDVPTEYVMSHVATVMTRDFLDPLEFYIHVS